MRREQTELPTAGLQSDQPSGIVRWTFPPAGEWQVEAEGEVTRLTLRLHRTTAPPVDPTAPESPREAAHFSAMAALHSLKSHLEDAGGGDPDLHSANVPGTILGHSATQDPEI